MVEDTSPSQDMVEISGNIAHKIVSYDKDVVEIKLADTIDSDKFGANFVKDVCIDEGTLLPHKILEEKSIYRRPSPKVSCQMTEANSDLKSWKNDDARKSVNELKPEAVVPVELPPSCKNEKQYSPGKESDDHDDGISADYIPSEKKIVSLQELLLLESAEESRLASTKNCDSSENQHPPNEVAVGQASINGNHEIEAAVPKTSDHVSSGVSSTMSEDHGAALGVKRTNQIDRHNPFIDRRSLVIEDISEPAACSVQAMTDDASTEPICAVGKTDSLANVESGSTELTEIRTAESGLDAACSSGPDSGISEKSSDDSENLASKATTDEAVDEAAVATCSPQNNSGHSDFNQEKCDVDGVSDDIRDFNQIHEESSIGTDNAVSKTLDPAVRQTVPESSRSTARAGNGDPCESDFFGPSIMSGPVSNSGHIAYCGSVSLRSDSSTTSTRSFAFPVLQREWISSPVRMAKAERRRHLGWRKGLICCKF